ncbi:UDP-N-acetylmuramoyl-L-alanyl-D-glutamate--2,6-diaminopimelate ligase [Rhodoluna sp.]|uniref:Mur ligase family protein n=1 Tax=Rhodoluna sp. TaxID=1969481 RepID=UPI0025D9185C|nr:UDP-N-acetylmuramoyl-L-alanyl-D-glutamate--2,6-diaminopimelate ligase [Rhodoluna sp.]
MTIEQIPPILRPDRVKPVSVEAFAKHFDLQVFGDASSLQITGISMNTGDLRPGDLFVAMPGKKTHGATFVTKALELGCVAIVTDQAGRDLIGEVRVPVLLLEEPRKKLGELAAFVYGNVAGQMPKLFATTGTNGKTSTSYLLEAILKQLGEITGLTSTAERHIAGEVIVSRLTTPESPEMQALIARMREKGVTAIAIEVSAQALSQLRVDGLHFDVAGFTNLSHDHLDDYKDMQEYLEAKLPLFTKARASRGVVCLDSKYGIEVKKQSEIPVVTITSELGVNADWHVAITAETSKYTSFVLAGPDGVNIRSRVPLLGAHMAANAGLAIVMLIEAGFDANRIAKAIAGGIDAYLPGRTERVSGDTGPNVYVDFGHSPDAFLNTLSAVRKVTDGRVFMVFGADGDRDASKRPAMAQVAAEGSDVLIITDHHPRFEDPASIRKTLMDAAKAARPDLEIYEMSPPEAAIRKAVSLAKPGDAILWAGPGHQDYRDIKGVRTRYSAREEARAALRENGWS